MLANKKVSIIIPVYNLEKYIGRCLDSVIFQTYSNWECICINDGSIDYSGKILDTYAEIDARFKVIHQKNAGVSAARNAGIRAASGEYITFVDGDDIILKDMLHVLVTSLETNQSDMSACGYWEGNENGETLLHHPPTKTVLNWEGDKHVSAELLDQLLPFSWAKLYRNSIIKKNCIEFEKGAFFAEDSMFVFRYMMYAESGGFVGDGLYVYCRRDESCTSHVQQGNFNTERYISILRHSVRFFNYIGGAQNSLSAAERHALCLLRIAGVCKVVLIAARRGAKKSKRIVIWNILILFIKAFQRTPKSLLFKVLKVIYKLRRLRNYGAASEK
ncbi:MAG: glycosyltransferase [Akkermansia sp.]|nr:glycosyltransferase [Akkermansia sp.]